MTQHATANAQDHRPVPSDQRFERRLVLGAKESLQELPICQATAILQQGGPAEVGQHTGHFRGSHRCFPLSGWESSSILIDVPRMRAARRCFSALALETNEASEATV